jgi:hypothetical protein
MADKARKQLVEMETRTAKTYRRGDKLFFKCPFTGEEKPAHAVGSFKVLKPRKARTQI